MLDIIVPSEQISSNYHDPCPLDLTILPSIDPAAIGVAVTFALLTALAIGLRILCTIKVTKHPKIEEYIAIIGFLFFTTYMGLEISLSYLSHGRPGARLFQLINESREYCIRLFVVAALSGPALTVCKMAGLSFLLRLLYELRTAPWQHRNLRIFVWVLIALSLTFSCASVAVAVWGCAPVDGLGWRPRDQCAVGTNVTAIVGGTLWCFVDLAMVVVVWRLIVGERSGRWVRRKKQVWIMVAAVTPMVLSSIVGMCYRLWKDGHTTTLWQSSWVQRCVYVDAYWTLLLCCAPALQLFQPSTSPKKKNRAATRFHTLYTLFTDPQSPPRRRRRATIHQDMRPLPPGIMGVPTNPNTMLPMRETSISGANNSPRTSRVYSMQGHTRMFVLEGPFTGAVLTSDRPDRVDRADTPSGVPTRGRRTEERSRAEEWNRARRALEGRSVHQAALD